MPKDAQALYDEGVALLGSGRLAEALARFDEALKAEPKHTDALNNRGVALWMLGRREEALASFERAIASNPGHADILYNRANALLGLGRFARATEDFEQVLALRPGHKYAFGNLAGAALNLCDWKRTAKLAHEIASHVERRGWIVPPFTVLGYSADPALQLEYAKANLRDKIPAAPRRLWVGTLYRHDKIRVAYLSADFCQHATGILMAELFERHDRARFELHAISFGKDDGSAMRARLVKAFDRFHDLSAQSDLETARLLRALEVDIAVDLKGYTTDARPGILSHRPSPIQVCYLGYPGTMGADFIDYMIADAIVLPEDLEPFFAERVVRLPDCYQVNDSTRAIAQRIPPRREAGLPAQGFVFCCFNVNWKITAPLFDIWMRLLGVVPGSVLWLLAGDGDAMRNLRAEAAARGIDPKRLIFAPRAKPDEHLARHRLADLFLDTLPVNAHTTASDALWAGLPLVTCLGTAFAGRVAASLLYAIGLPELATGSLDAYEALAVKLANDPSLLQNIREKLAHNRLAAPLFDTDRTRRHIEDAYKTMWENWQAGMPPRGFSVPPRA